MGARGRESIASLEVVRPENAITALTRPAPPDHLTDEQASEWESVVGRLPADWFPRETHGLLAQYCCHVVTGRHIAAMIENFKAGEQGERWLEEYDRLLKMQERESRAVCALARGMRISQQSLYSQNRKRGTTVKKPWE